MPAALAGLPFTVIDISVTGSLGLVAAEVPIDSQQAFRLGREDEALILRARVVRVAPSSEPAGWRTAVTFDEGTREQQHQIGAMVVRLLREGSK